MGNKRKAYNKVVFIDKDLELAANYHSILKRKKLSNYLIHFEKAKEAISYIKSINNEEEVPDYVLLDLYIPRRDSFQFLKFIDRHVRLQGSTEIYVCTSSRKKNDLEEVMKYPFVSAYLEKPLPSEFIELLITDQRS
jgi:response regulator of citrate/malate metabolism